MVPTETSDLTGISNDGEERLGRQYRQVESRVTLTLPQKLGSEILCSDLNSSYAADEQTSDFVYILRTFL